MTAGEAIHAAFPGEDPYQAAARNALARILYATESAEAQCAVLGACLAFFCEDPPLSLLFDSPAANAEICARKLRALSSELMKAVAILRSLRPYVNQFDSPSSVRGISDGSTGQVHRRDGEVSAAGADECPF